MDMFQFSQMRSERHKMSVSAEQARLLREKILEEERKKQEEQRRAQASGGLFGGILGGLSSLALGLVTGGAGWALAGTTAAGALQGAQSGERTGNVIQGGLEGLAAGGVAGYLQNIENTKLQREQQVSDFSMRKGTLEELTKLTPESRESASRFLSEGGELPGNLSLYQSPKETMINTPRGLYNTATKNIEAGTEPVVTKKPRQTITIWDKGTNKNVIRDLNTWETLGDAPHKENTKLNQPEYITIRDRLYKMINGKEILLYEYKKNEPALTEKDLGRMISGLMNTGNFDLTEAETSAQAIVNFSKNYFKPLKANKTPSVTVNTEMERNLDILLTKHNKQDVINSIKRSSNLTPQEKNKAFNYLKGK